MEPLVLELVCRDYKLTDVAVAGLKKNLRLARSDIVRKRREIAKLEVQLFYANRSLFQFREQLMEKDKVLNTISDAMKHARIGA